MTAFVGVDPSTKSLAMVAVEGSRVVMKKYPLQASDLLMRMADAHTAAMSITRGVRKALNVDEVLVYMEAPVFVRGRQALIKQAQVSGAAVSGFVHSGERPYLVPVSTWKKEVVGKGNANKGEVAAWLRDNAPALFHKAAGDQDLIDAACLSEYGRLVGDRLTRMA